mgnify:CR=1 FL=1
MDNDYIFKAFIVNAAEYDNGNKDTSGAWLMFPTTKDEVSALLEKIGLRNNANHREYFIDDYVCGNDDMNKFLSVSLNIDELNYLASRITELDDLEMTVFQAAIQRDDIVTLTDAINLTYNTEYYNVISDMYSWENVGAYFASQQGFDIAAMGDLADYFDYEAYGKDYANQHGGELAEGVYIEDGCAEWTKAYNGMIENIPPEYIVTRNGENIQYDYNFDIQFEASKDLAFDIDRYMRGIDNDYAAKYPDDFEQMKYFSDCLLEQRTLAVKDMLAASNRHEGDTLVDRICEFEQTYQQDKYMLYQVKGGEQTRDYRFMSYSQLQKQGLTVDKNNYELTYVCGLSEKTTLENLFTQFNTDCPQDFKGRSMSVSDVVVMKRNGEEKAYYCDSAGFKEVPQFLAENHLETAEKTEEQNFNQIDGEINNEPPKQGTIAVLVVEPMQEPYVKRIPTGLEAMQKEVGGLIACAYPSEKPIALICNDEGKINGMQLNRALYDTEGEMYDIVAGTFLIAGINSDNSDFISLSPDLQRQFANRFKNPEIFVRINGEIQAVPVKPSIRKVLNKLKKEQDGRDKPEPQKKPPNQEI